VAITLSSIFVVRRDRPDLYEHLRARFGTTSQVILDRRNGDRRCAVTPVTADRRRADRRQSPTHAERAVWEDAGYCVVFQPVTASVLV
jgi:hypothetical protein